MFVGRILLALIFLISGWGKITSFAATSGFVGTVFPLAELLTILVIVIEIGGAILLIVGYRVRYAALALAAFTLVAGFAFHFDLSDQMQTTQLLKNLAITGGLLYVIAAGAGSYCIDKDIKKKEEVQI